jgi:maleate cis-trans isomerase
MEKSSLLGIGSRVNHPAYGDGVIIGLDVIAYKVCFITYGLKNVGKEYTGWEIIEKIEAEETMSFSAAEQSLIKILKKFSDITEIVELGDKWDDGMMILQPKDTSIKSKEIPIETFFHKIVMVRDRLRVMEQRINSSKLTDEEKVNLQQYVTRIYGSLTTFNVLFKYKEDHFVGERS